MRYDVCYEIDQVFSLCYCAVWIPDSFRIGQNFDQNAATTTFHPWPYVFIIYNLIQVLFGTLLGMEELIRQFRQAGHWHVNVEKAVFLGLPPLVLYSIYMLYFGQVIPAIGSGFFMREVMLDAWLQSYSGVVLGYVLATVFQKSGQEIKT